ncbi:MAG: hypothetical protein PHT76_11495 [Anaerostipes sp.]|nr:hypothetical protein [Anaerostipes sp.]
MRTGTTSTGFKFKVKDETLDNMELVDALGDSDNENEAPLAMSRICKLLLGDDKKKLYDHVRAEDGRVPAEAIGKEITEIFQLMGEEGKNL